MSEPKPRSEWKISPKFAEMKEGVSSIDLHPSGLIYLSYVTTEHLDRLKITNPEVGNSLNFRSKNGSTCIMVNGITNVRLGYALMGDWREEYEGLIAPYLDDPGKAIEACIAFYVSMRQTHTEEHSSDSEGSIVSDIFSIWNSIELVARADELASDLGEMFTTKKVGEA